jgi:hypothetical protein
VQPFIQRVAKICIAEGGVGAAALGVAAYDHLFDLEMGHGVLDDGRGADIILTSIRTLCSAATARHPYLCNAIGNVAMHENIPRLAAADGRLRHAAVRTANPKDLGPLALCELLKGVRVFLDRALRVLAVAGNYAVNWVQI